MFFVVEEVEVEKKERERERPRGLAKEKSEKRRRSAILPLVSSTFSLFFIPRNDTFPYLDARQKLVVVAKVDQDLLLF